MTGEKPNQRPDSPISTRYLDMIGEGFRSSVITVRRDGRDTGYGGSRPGNELGHSSHGAAHGSRSSSVCITMVPAQIHSVGRR